MKRTFSKEFKVKACELVIKDGIKHAVVAEKMGISHIMLYRWIDEYETHGEEAFVGKGHQRSEDAELRKLRKENGGPLPRCGRHPAELDRSRFSPR